ncbi:hypothetical protein Tsubulata_034011 [Turnera subulata]|uniref:Pentacotripeptide-repeat region of PRORP domain-containing protein n=1 Tax=Turnera subulata TaxID=218843 RepID=A0A9Q0FY29_9ROSI|nr:hypothetical protein Tsubulata_034011 [Turnera subulata]
MNFFFAAKKTTSRYYHSATLLLPSPQILLHLLHLSLSHKSLALTRQCHARVVTSGFTQSPFLATKLISAYAVCGVPAETRLVFNSAPEKTVYLWNTLINGYVKNRSFSEAFALFAQMCRGGGVVSPDDYTLATVSKVCGEIRGRNAGKLIHGRSLKTGVVVDVVVANSLMSMYGKCDEFGECLKLFDEMPVRNVSSWNAVIAGYVDSGNLHFDAKILGCLKTMLMEGLKPDVFTISSILPLCGESEGMYDFGRELHGFIVRNALFSDSDVHLECCLIDMYSRSKKINASKRVFDRMKWRNVYGWTAMINGYVRNGALAEALCLFRRMQMRDAVQPNHVTLLSILPACNSVAALIGVKQIHGFAIRKNLSHDVSFSNALIDMYSKCGSLNSAKHVFEDASFARDAISWSSMISGCGLHGKGHEAVSVYNEMLRLGNKLDMISLVGVLSACGKCGLVDEGLSIYKSAVNDHGIEPTVEICACVVDMLGKSGQLSLALEFIETMPVAPSPSVWGALVSASIIHGNSEMQDLAYKFLIQLEPDNPSNYVSLSNLHASSRRWDVVAEVRTMMKEKGLAKTPGCSWISITNTTHSFYAADKTHPCSKSIYEVLDGLVLLMKGAGRSLDLGGDMT